ncbi:MAG: hypothetical protein KDA80_20855 [Planctomycetaceae bacterium]|nr:hypothetical protein [Planctomycetaceae bacterium]
MSESTIDKTLMYLVAGLLIAGFVFLSILGMNTVARQAETAAAAEVEQVVEQVEIGSE